MYSRDPPYIILISYSFIKINTKNIITMFYGANGSYPQFDYRTLNCGNRTLNCGNRTLNCGNRTLNCGNRTLAKLRFVSVGGIEQRLPYLMYVIFL